MLDARSLALPDVRGAGGEPAVRTPSDSRIDVEIPEGGLDFEELERALLVQALRKSGGSQTGAARLLGLSRDTLRYRLEKFAIDVAATRES